MLKLLGTPSCLSLLFSYLSGAEMTELDRMRMETD